MPILSPLLFVDDIWLIFLARMVPASLEKPRDGLFVPDVYEGSGREIDSRRMVVEDRKKLLDRIYDNRKQGGRPLSPLLSTREPRGRETAVEVYIKGLRMKSYAGSGCFTCT